jgi:hypothetical protein
MSDINLNNSEKKQTNDNSANQIGYGFTLGFWVGFPVLFGFFVGRYLVTKLNLPEYSFYIIIGLFVILSFYGLIKTTQDYIKENDK